MSWLSSAIRKNKKGLKKTLKIGARVVLAGVTRGKSEKVISQAKSIGAAVKTYRGLTKRHNKSENAALAKAMSVQRPTVVPIKAMPATTMPGGAPLKGVRAAKRTRAAKPAAAAKAPKRPRKARSGGKRPPPKGGKDFKALSASWKAAGKPGTWLGWVKSH
jgi:hypothetical protein